MRAIIWDMGGIIYDYFTESILRRAESEGWDIRGIPIGPTSGVADPDFLAADRGEIGEPEYGDRLQSRMRAAGIEIVIPDDVRDGFLIRSETVEALAGFKAAGYLQSVLTNDGTRWLGEGWWETWELREYFDAIIDVLQVGVKKPAPEPYLASVDALGLEPGECVFVDDLHINCEGAERVGIASVWFDITDPGGSLERVRRRLEAG